MDTNEAPALRCKYCRKAITRHRSTWATSGGQTISYEYYSLLDESIQGGMYCCPHWPMSEVEEVQELLREYRPPQKKNPFVEKSRPWDTKWRKRKR
jgi:hypothetical protein